MTLIEEVAAQRLPSVETRRAIRLAARVSQVRMARELGVHRQTLIRWETGSLEPRGDHRARYARLLTDLQRIAP